MTEQQAQSVPQIDPKLTHRQRLLAGVPVKERTIDAAGIPTAVLEGGEGPPLVLLHGPGEAAVNWRWVIPDLVSTHRVIAPDLPAHGSTGAGEVPLDADRARAWLGAVIDKTCHEKPVVVGHVLGGAIGARFAIHGSAKLRGLVLVDSLGLARFKPAPRFAMGLLGFQIRPTEASYERFMHQCAYDLDTLRDDMGETWESFKAYNLELAAGDDSKQAGRLFRSAGLPRIPAEDLDRIAVPTALIWGREDRANRLRVAERVSARHGWPLHVIDNAADDPARDRPVAFVETLHAVLDAM